MDNHFDIIVSQISDSKLNIRAGQNENFNLNK